MAASRELGGLRAADPAGVGGAREFSQDRGTWGWRRWMAGRWVPAAGRASARKRERRLLRRSPLDWFYSPRMKPA